MDPNILSEQRDFLPDLSTGDEGANYLRRLKGGIRGVAPAEADVKSDGKVPAARASDDWKERRQSPRLRCSGSVEFRAEGSDVRLWGTLIDISLHGCYVEMGNTSPVDTRVHLVLKSCGHRIQTAGTVRASYPALGMGICFDDIEPEEQVQLRQLIAMLAGSSGLVNSVSSAENAASDSPPQVDPKALLDEVTEFFRNNQLLSRNEFHQMAKRVRRP